MERRQRLAIAAASLMLITASALASPALATATDFGPIFECPTEVNLLTLVGLRHRSESAGRDCYGSGELSFVAFRAAPEGLGGTTAFLVEPGWLDADRTYGNGLMLTNELAEYGYMSRWTDVRVPPELEERFGALYGHWVEVSGHFDDPAAATCHVTEGDPETFPPPAAVIDSCRNGFALTSIEPIVSPCPAASGWLATVSTPEHLRAICLSGSELRFEARGGSTTTTYGIDAPFDGTWELYDADAGDAGQAPPLEAFAPPASGLHVPAGLMPGDGVGGRDVVWEIRAHVDDPRALDCRPDADGIVVDGARLEWDVDEAVAFCRNHLVIDEATWIRPAIATTAPTPSDLVDPPAAAPPAAAPPTVPPTFATSAPGPLPASRTSTDDAAGQAPPPSLSMALGLLAAAAAALTLLGERLRRA